MNTIDQAIHSARTAFLKWGRMPYEERVEFLRTYEKNLQAHKTELIETISRETGKPLWESTQEVGAMIGKIEIAIEAIQERCPEKKIGDTLYTHHKPHGVVAVFGPFNFPGHLPNGHIVPALLAGNTVVFKPSEYTPLVAQKMVQCMDHFPEGVVNLVQGGADTGQSLANHPKIDGLFFTGSHNVGSLLSEAFRKQPGKILALEMGGNNPLIVSEPGDLEAAAFQTILSAYISAGQRCSCARRLIVRDQEESFLKVLIEMIASIRVGPYTDKPEPFMGPVIDNKSAEHLLKAQAALKAQGGKSLIEMRRISEKLPLLTPGLMDVTGVDSPIDEELFGPFLKVIRVPSFEAAIQEANRTAYGLSAALISTNRAHYTQFFHEVRAGIINWNHPTTGASSRAPFGGIGKSGNFHPSGYYAADYCSYPVASMERETIPPKQPHPGISI